MWQRIKQHLSILLCCTGIICLILYREIAIAAIIDGLKLCVQAIIPSLLPYMFLTGILSGNLSGIKVPLLNRLGRLCRVPKGAESILLLGLLSGYPVGAKLIADSYTAGRLDRHSAQRMLPFCNNAGPSFIFGFLAPLFANKYIPLILWLMHMLSAFITGLLLPGGSNTTHRYCPTKTKNATTVLFSALKSLAGICGWVILFKILLALADTWFLDRCAPIVRVCVSGLCELVNGCISLHGIANESTRMILCACLLACGGMCIYMQTASVTADLKLDMYVSGKLLQTLISLLVSVPVACCFGTVNKWFWCIWLCSAVSVTALIVLLKRRVSKKVVAIS